MEIFFVVALFIAAGITVIYIAVIHSKKPEQASYEMGLISGECYDVVLNDGSKKLNLTFTHAAYGNQSQNGNINFYFTKEVSYRGGLIKRKIMIKHNNIWKIFEQGTTNTPEIAETETFVEEYDSLFTHDNDLDKFDD